MWSSLFLDYSLHKNFHIGFSSHKNDIHVHLSQWQYWWWFWFAILWTLYFCLVLKLYYNKTENYNIIMNTSLRSHGKWGDFLVSLIPLSWCGNILINSNFILRMIEWQNESSLFTVRIQGKQWYWAYKYSSDTDFRLKNVYINVGNNNWVKTNSQSDISFNKDTSTLSFIYDLEFRLNHEIAREKKLRSSKFLKKANNSSNSTAAKHHNVVTTIELDNSYPLNRNYKKILNNKYLLKKDTSVAKTFNKYSEITEVKFKRSFKNIKKRKDLKRHYELDISLKNGFRFFDHYSNNLKKSIEIDTLDDVDESADNVRPKSNKFPYRLVKGVLTKQNIKVLQHKRSLKKKIMLTYKINKSDATNKIPQPEQFWGFRQKRYKKLRMFKFQKNTKYDNKSYTKIENFSEKTDIDKYNLYTSVRTNKYKNEMIPVTLARRLLRTKRTLILPAHINITLITNSYDVVHSWFVPGLGLKIDCVPGRSTHHSLYLDNIGFYYGQCAEICGRYHHHMPIRVCALTFEHFMLWWQTRGLPRLYRSKYFQKNKSVLLHKFH